ncbi:hypothetical protein [Haloprofundus salilacus]|uniref:DUF7835 family putative zinc beta-ribbon protein n=1 Tax=Haloprofundus salilacus TaxID=2876190 RepID=UPI001CCDF4F5|nr:hypothetical protein [Haloprofundus salilacus]
MSTRTEPHVDGRREYCSACDERTLHEVTIEQTMRHGDATSEKNRKFSKVPRRKSRCKRCGTVDEQTVV